MNYNGTLVTFAGANPVAGDFRIGLSFTDADSVVGSQGSGGFKFTDFAGSTGTFVRAVNLTNTNERPMDFATVNGVPLLATLETNGNTATPAATFSTVRVYELLNPAAPNLVASGRAQPANGWYPQGTSGPFSGAVTFGNVTATGADIFAISANNGIQALHLSVTVPEPSALVLLTCAFTGFGLRRQRQRR